MQNVRTRQLVLFTMISSAVVATVGLGADAPGAKPPKEETGASFARPNSYKVTRQRKTSELTSSFDACKGMKIITESEYKKNPKIWDTKIQSCEVSVSPDVGFTVGSLSDAVEKVKYLEFAQKIAAQVKANLEKNIAFATAARECFVRAGGEETACSMKDGKYASRDASCQDTISKLCTNMSGAIPKLRRELALARTEDTRLKSAKMTAAKRDSIWFMPNEERISVKLGFFNGANNPVGGKALTPDEIKQAEQDHANDLEKLKAEWQVELAKRRQKDPNFGNSPADKNVETAFMNQGREKKMEEHQNNYLKLLHQEAPVFAALKQAEWKDGRPSWKNKSIVSSFEVIKESAQKELASVSDAIKSGKLEFGRTELSADNAIVSYLTPGKRDLIYYMGLKPAVEAVLAKDRADCGVATGLYAHLENRSMQNNAAMVAATVLSFGVGGAIGAGSAGIGTLSGATVANLALGAGLGAGFLADSVKDYQAVDRQLNSRSGLGGDREGGAIQSVEKLEEAKNAVLLNATLGFLGFGGGTKATGAVIRSAEKAMVRENPEFAQLLQKAGKDTKRRENMVSDWFKTKVQAARGGAPLTENDERVMKSLSAGLQKNGFFNSDENFDLYLKTISKALEHRPGDPADLGQKAVDLMLSFDRQAFTAWDTGARSGLHKVWSEGVEELRTMWAKDPASYAKIKTDPAAQEKLVKAALRRSGVEESKINEMYACTVKAI